jgi:hypothetical protein
MKEAASHAKDVEGLKYVRKLKKRSEHHNTPES